MTDELDKPTPIHDAMVAYVHQACGDDPFMQRFVPPRPNVVGTVAFTEDGRPIDAKSTILELQRTTKYEVQPPEWEVPVDNGRGNIVGFIDLCVDVYRSWHQLLPRDDNRLQWETRDDETRVCFEIKPEIPSIGALLRQINKYRHYQTGPSEWVVVAASDRYAGVLQSQGIHLVVPRANPPGQQEVLPL